MERQADLLSISVPSVYLLLHQINANNCGGNNHDYITVNLKFYQIRICAAFLQIHVSNFIGHVVYKKSLLFQ